MSTVTVFVDDAVQGHLPMVCVRSGAPADGLHRVEQPIGGGSGWAWLLIFLGPVGWLALIIVMVVGGRSRYLTVRLPKTQATLAEERRWFRAAVAAGALMVVAGIGSFVIAGQTSSPTGNVMAWSALITAGISALAALAFAIKRSLERVGIDLDASGRWVTLRNVHPNFAEAVEARRRATTVDAATT